MTTAWCPHCRLSTQVDSHGRCMNRGCDRVVLDGQPLVIEPPTHPCGPGRGSNHITAAVLREGYELYLTGLSLRAVAEAIWPRTQYASPRSCANSIHNQWRALGWRLRSKGAVTAARNWKHGKLRSGARDPEFRKQQRRASGEIRAQKCAAILDCRGRRRGTQCQMWTPPGSDYCHLHR